jgi:hypothetical protein
MRSVEMRSVEMRSVEVGAMEVGAMEVGAILQARWRDTVVPDLDRIVRWRQSLRRRWSLHRGPRRGVYPRVGGRRQRWSHVSTSRRAAAFALFARTRTLGFRALC